MSYSTYKGEVYEMKDVDPSRDTMGPVKRSGEIVNQYKQDEDDMAYMGKRQQLSVRLLGG